MKIRLLFLLAVLLLYSCIENPTTTASEKTDTLLLQSGSIMTSSENSAALLDSVATETAEKVGNNIDKLTELVKVYQTQSKTVRAVKEVIIRDTVYIETKKNFWGKEKKKVTTSSDSSTNETQIVDTVAAD